MSTLEDRLYIGSRAKEVIENEAYIQAFEQIEAEIIEQWKTAPLRDVEGRERLHQFLTMLNKVRATLQSTMETGKLAELELQHKRTLQERAKDAMQQFSDPY